MGDGRGLACGILLLCVHACGSDSALTGESELDASTTDMEGQFSPSLQPDAARGDSGAGSGDPGDDGDASTTGPDDDGGAGSASDDAVGCFKVFGSATDGVKIHDLYFSGSGFDPWEGEVVRVVVDGGGWGTDYFAIAEARIESGSFDLFMPGTIERDYTGIGIYIDTARDRMCNDGEPLWNWVIGPLPADDVIVHLIGPQDMWTQAGSCNINGMFDLAVPLSCDP